MTTDHTKFGFATTIDQVLDGIDLTGKTIVSTGGTSGRRAESARALAFHGFFNLMEVPKFGRCASRGPYAYGYRRNKK